MASFTSALNLLVFSYILLSDKLKFSESFDVARSSADWFVSPDCDSFTCPDSTCDRFNALCVTDNCKNCICTAAEYSQHFVGYGNAKGRCLEGKDLDTGCYSFADGSFVRDYWTHSPVPECKNNNCFKTAKFVAPKNAQNTMCSLLWRNSSVLINSEPWKPVVVDPEDFEVSNFLEDSGRVQLKINQNASYNWSGTILKLQVRCHSKSDQSSHEQHCVMIKFYGNYGVTDKRQPISKPMPTESGSTNSEYNRPYKVSTIVLAVISIILLLLLIVATFVICRRRVRAWGAHSDDGQPFSDAEERPQL